MKDKNIQELIDLYHSGKLDIVKKKVVKLIEKYPNSFILYNLFGAVLTDQKNLNEAVINYRKSIQINPDYAEGYNNLGSVLYKLEKFQESIDSYQRAIQIKPNFAEAYNNLGVTFKKLGKLDESVNSYQQAIKINPNYVEAYNNFGNLLKDIGKVDEAILNYEEAIKINAHFAEGYSNLGSLLIEIGRVDEAHNCDNKLLALKPDNIGYRISSALSMSPIVQSVDEINSYRDKYEKGLESLKKYKYVTEKPGLAITANFFHLAYHGKDNLKILKKTSDLFRQIIPSINYVSKNINNPKKQKKIKVGFISEFLTSHTVGRIFEGLIKNIDRKKFEIVIFHTLQTKKSLVKKDIDESANNVVNLSNKIQEQQQQVEKENLDILFYTDIGMSASTYFLAFSRLAPVQIVSWGHTETTGISTIDYFLSSTFFEPDKTKKKYSERLICLDQIPTYYEPHQNIGPMKNRSELKLPVDAKLYGCPQSLFKLHPDFDAILAEILLKDPRGYVILVGGVEGKGKERFWSETLKKRWSKNFSVLNERILFLERLSLLEFFSLCSCVDVLLDPLHFGGGYSFLLTTMVGTPSITMPGSHLRNNMTAGAYKQMKILTPPIVKSFEEYVDLAIKLTYDSKINRNLREEIKISANKYLYKNLKALKAFEQFLEEAYLAAQLGNKLEDGYTIRIS